MKHKKSARISNNNNNFSNNHKSKTKKVIALIILEAIARKLPVVAIKIRIGT